MSPSDDAMLEHAVEAALATVLGPDAREPAMRVGVAYSGGVDSTALLDVAASLQRRGLVEVVALHVHHGLASAADAWLAHCRHEAGALGVAFDSEHVTPARHGVSIEADARRLRYAALVRLCATHRCAALLTAHHADDQAETVVLNLARGAGIGGLAAIARSRRIGDLTLLRPLVDIPAATVAGYVAAHGLAHVVDPSNNDRRYTRNAIRHEVMPALRRIAPTIATRLAQTAAHASTLQGLLDEIGHEDLAGDGTPGDQIDVDRLAALSDARASNALRVWLAQRGLRAPSAAALAEMLDQLLNASPEAQIALLHEQQTLRLYRGRVSIDRGGPPRTTFTALSWHGEPSIAVPEWNGALHFERGAARGFDAAALRAGPIALRARRGGERLRTRVDGPSRTLKNLYQEAGIAAWRRDRLPLVYLGERLLHAAGLGDNATTAVDAAPGLEAVALRWEAAR